MLTATKNEEVERYLLAKIAPAGLEKDGVRRKLA